MPLTDKQSRFIDEYLVDLNATQAAIRAGYSKAAAASIGSENLSKPEIQAELSKRQLDRQERTQVTQDRVVEELARLAFSDLRSLFKPDGTMKQPRELTAKEAACLSSIECFEKFEGAGEGRKQAGTVVKVRLWDKLAALDKLGRHLGMWTERMALEAFLALFPGPTAARLREYLGEAAARVGSDGSDRPSPE